MLLFGIGAGVMVVILILVLVFRDSAEQYNWEQEHKPDETQPYDNDLIFNLLQARTDDDSFYNMTGTIEEDLKPSKITGPASYVFIGVQNHYTREDLDSLLAFVANGNNAFLSVNELSYGLGDALQISYCGEHDADDVHRTFTDTAANLNLIHPNLKLKDPLKLVYKPINKAKTYTWKYFFIDSWCETNDRVAKLGKIEKQHNFIKVPYEDGFFYLHSTPIVFTNYYMRDSSTLAYAQNVFAHLPDGAIYWDEGSRYYHYNDESPQSRDRNPFGQSQLKYILSEPAMKWAFYTLLAGVVLYIMFYMKRRQKIIPVVEPYANTSVEYVQTVGGLYFMKQEHRKLTDQQFKLFLTFVRNRYRLNTQQLDEEFMKRLAMNSMLEPEKIRYIFGQQQGFIGREAISETELIDFNRSLEYFYKNCK